MPKSAGTVCVIEEEKIFDWKIDDFLQIEGEKVNSPVFFFSDASWMITIYRHENWDRSIEYVSLYLNLVSLPGPVTMTAKLGIKIVNGNNNLERTFTKFFSHEFVGFYLESLIISRSDLIERKSELLPSGTLTVVCTLNKSESSGVNVMPVDPLKMTTESNMQKIAKIHDIFPTARKDLIAKILQYCEDDENKAVDALTRERQFLDASVQTGKITEHELLDASVQTGEITGIWKLQKHLHDISLSGDVSDVILKVGDQEFKSHRCILAARSPVFLAMMKNKMKENVTGVVDIEDVDPKTFSDFLHYLYTGNTEYITPENASKLFTVADKYQVETLKENCLDYMLVNVSVENFCDVFMLSIQHDEEKLKETCFQYFGKHYLNVIQSCKWQSFCCENPIICNELHIKHAKLTNKNTT